LGAKGFSGEHRKRGFLNLASLGVDHFKDLFMELQQEKVGEMLKLISLFPKLVDREENRELFREVSKEELRAVISKFQ
jgi:hypothetical protein